MTPSAIFKKHFAMIFVAITAANILILPLNASATVPVVDEKAIGVLKDILKEETFQSGQLRSLVRKEYVLDPAVKSLASLMLQAITKMIIEWVQGGGNNNFVSNLLGALGKAADEAAGEFLNQLAKTNLCAPIAAPVRNAFRRPSISLSSRISCTATDIFRNLQTSYEQFLDDFTKGGWPAYNATLSGGNNYIDALINAYDAKLLAESQRVAVVQAKYKAGSGFLGVNVKKEVCPEYDSYTGQPICHTVDFQTTPGKLVAEQVVHVFNSGIDQAVNADEIAEAIDAVITLLINKLISSAQAGLAANDESSGLLSRSFSGATTPPPPPPSPESRIQGDITLINRTVAIDIDPAIASASSTLPKINAALSRFSTTIMARLDPRVVRLMNIRTDILNAQVALISSKGKLAAWKIELEQILKDINEILSKPNEIPAVDLADLYSKARQISADLDNEVNNVTTPNANKIRSLTSEALLLIPEVDKLPTQ